MRSSIAFPARRVSSLTDLHKYKEGLKPSVKVCKSEENIPSTEFADSFDVSQVHDASVKDGQQLYTRGSVLTIDETVRK